MAVHVLRSRATVEQVDEMLQVLVDYIKVAVDVEQAVLAGGGAMHADCEAALLQDGSHPDTIWGADWIPSKKAVAFKSMINLRPRLGNRSMEVQSDELRMRIAESVKSLLDVAP